MPRVVKRTPVKLLITSLTISGRLRFVNIEKGDVKGGKAYACHAINYFIRKDVPGPEHYIEVLGCKFV